MSKYGVFSHSEISNNTKNKKSRNKIKAIILKFVRPKENLVFTKHDFNVIDLLRRLGVSFNHLNEQTFQHNFTNSVDLVCLFGLKLERKIRYLFRCNLVSAHRLELQWTL